MQNVVAYIVINVCVAREFGGDMHAIQHILCSETTSIVRYYRLKWCFRQGSFQDTLNSVGHDIVVFATEFDSVGAGSNDR